MTGKVQGYLSNSKSSSRLELYRILFNMAMQETIVFDRHILFCVLFEALGFRLHKSDFLSVWFQENCETGLHLAIMLEDGYSLYIVDFIIQNSVM